MERDEFLRNQVEVHLTTAEEAETLLEYYLENYDIGEDNSLHMGNWSDYPYAFCYDGGDAIHGRTRRNGKVIEFSEWAERVGLHSYEFDESDKTLSFLFE